MTCEGDMSKVEVRTLPVRARSHGTTATKLNKQAYLYIQTCKGFDPLDPKGRTLPNLSGSAVLPIIGL